MSDAEAGLGAQTMTSSTTDVLVVGASAAGVSVVESLRRAGFAGRVTLMGAEPHLPYDRPPLSKQVLAGDWEPQRTRLRPQEKFDALGVDLMLGTPAIALDATARRVFTADHVVGADHVVIATGAEPRRLPAQPDVAGIHMLRTVDDAEALRAAMREASRLIVVGEGVLGSEIAATATDMGQQVVMIGPQPTPMLAQLGRFASDLLAQIHREAGVQLRLGTAVAEFVADTRVRGVRLTDGELLAGDLVVVAVGCVPATGWLTGSGLVVDDGVVCDASCRAADGIYAVGDVARWLHPGLGRTVRLENRTNVTEQAAVVAASIVGAERAYAPTPYFWTDQFATKIQVYGTIPPGADVSIVEGSVGARRFVARHTVDDRVVAVLGWGMPKAARLHAQEITSLVTATE